jgi:hypothetical protein
LYQLVKVEDRDLAAILPRNLGRVDDRKQGEFYARLPSSAFPMGLNFTRLHSHRLFGTYIADRFLVGLEYRFMQKDR